MRPAQQNRRMRGRGSNNNNNNRKGPNPLSRNYESNGPDVKIRGNAQHIAEKYTTLARDAQATGDRVIAENYLQHAEHYNRIILAAQAQNPVPMQREDSFEEDGYEDDDSTELGNNSQQPALNHGEVYDGSGPQPVIDGTPAEVMYGEENSRPSNRNPRQHNNRSERNYGERQPGERSNDRQGDRQNDRQARMQRPRRHQRPEYGSEQNAETGHSAQNAAFDPAGEQPFIADAPNVAAPNAVAPSVAGHDVVNEPAVAAIVQNSGDVGQDHLPDSLTEAPVVRRRPRAAVAAKNSDMSAVAAKNSDMPAVAAKNSDMPAVAAKNSDGADADKVAEAAASGDESAENTAEETTARRPRRVLRPRRPARAAASEGEAQDQDTALAETE